MIEGVVITPLKQIEDETNIVVDVSYERRLKASLSELEKAGDSLKSTRPTAVNLSWAVDKIITEIKDMKKSNLQEITHSLIRR